LPGASALERGGLEHSSKDFYNSVYTLLNREQKETLPRITRTESGAWTLIELKEGTTRKEMGGKE
jgi:hypothetical protein